MDTQTAETEQPKPNPAAVVGTPSSRNRAAVLAAMDAELPAAKPEPKPEKPKAEAKPAEPTEDGPEAEESDAEPADEETPDEDPKVQKGIDRIKAAEKRMRLDLQKERAAFDEERGKHKEALAKVESFDQLARRVKYDPVSVLKALGVDEDAYQDIAKIVNAHSPEFMKDPKNKENVARYMKEREEADRNRAAADRIEKLEKEMARRDREAEEQRFLTKFADTTLKHVTDDVPLVKRLHDKTPDRARNDLLDIANVMAEELGHPPEHREVVAMLEQVMRLEYEEAGIELPTAKPKAEQPKVTKKAESPKQVTKQVNGRVDPRTRRSELLQSIEANELD